MNEAAPAPDITVEAFSDPDQAFGDAIEDLERRTASATDIPGTTAFEEGIRLKYIIDKHENTMITRPSLSILALLLNCETRLWHIYSDTPIRYNPFLVHWVETLQRLARLDTPSKGLGSASSSKTTSSGIIKARAECIKRILSEKDPAVLLSSAPRALYEVGIESGSKSFDDTDPFNIQPFIDMLVEDGIYDSPPALDAQSMSRTETSANGRSQRDLESNPEQGSSARLTTTSQASASTQLQSPSLDHTTSAKQWKENIRQKLELEPDATTQELTRLPLELSFLDFLNEMLDQGILQLHGIEPAPIVIGYIQHSLRTIEMMGEPSLQNSGHIRNGIQDGETIWEYGKEAQSRAVTLLLLFVKNLIRKNFLSVELLYFEIQEICVRYVWIKEVREFRTWVEEGVERGGS